MSSLVLVRHAQASFLSDDYDKLSGGGQRQARRLAEYWVQQNVAFDLVFTGPRERHRQTAELVSGYYRDAGLPWTDTVELPELDEHHLDQFVSESINAASDVLPEIRPLVEQLADSRTEEEKHRSFQRLFEAVARLWIEDAPYTAGIESWREFQDRVRRAIGTMRNGQDRGRRIVAFTSVGPITIALQLALHGTDRTALELGWRLRNCSLTEFVFTKDRFTLDSFNGIPHLDDSTLRTYR